MEIEKKYLVKDIPSLNDYPYKHIIQAYIADDPVIRIRKMNDDYFLTVKSKGAIMREEFELPITAEAFHKLFAKIDNHAIEKNRYYIPLGNGLTAELDVYFDYLEGLTTVEVEFDTLEEADAFTPPEWFGKDVSLDHRYKNSMLAVKGKPVL